MHEFEIIARYFAPLARNPGAFGLLDDAATIQPSPGMELVVTVDAMIEGVHFLPDDPPDSVARKLLRVNLSDLAAMGAAPVGYVLTAGVPGDRDGEWFGAFAGGLRRDQEEFGIGLLGGDTVASSGGVALSLTALGEVPAGQALLRSGAREGDEVWVSGTIGDAVLGLALLKGDAQAPSDEARAFLTGRYRLPEPRLELGRSLVGRAHAAIDVSDGVVADLGHICATSGVGARIVVEDIPTSDAARAVLDRGEIDLASLVTGGDDYELLFTAPETERQALAALAKEIGVPLTRIGRIEAGEAVALVDRSGATVRVQAPGFQHF